MKDIYFVRHGKPDFPTADSYCIGKTDFPLSDIGKIQAALLAPAVAELDIKQAYSSALLRAVETLEILGIEGGNLYELNEADFGEWDGLKFVGRSQFQADKKLISKPLCAKGRRPHAYAAGRRTVF